MVDESSGTATADDCGTRVEGISVYSRDTIDKIIHNPQGEAAERIRFRKKYNITGDRLKQLTEFDNATLERYIQEGRIPGYMYGKLGKKLYFACEVLEHLRDQLMCPLSAIEEYVSKAKNDDGWEYITLPRLKDYLGTSYGEIGLSIKKGDLQAVSISGMESVFLLTECKALKEKIKNGNVR